jgi:hypothetical protein
MVHQDAIHVELDARQTDGAWRFTEFLDSNNVFELESIGCQLKLGDIYEKVST